MPGDISIVIGGKAHLLQLIGPPRKILLLVFWDVGDTLEEQVRAAFLISVPLAILTVLIYVWAAVPTCGKRSRPAAAAALRGRSQPKRLAAQDVGTCTAKPPQHELWTVHNKRYDLRDFVARHPGGVEAISLGQGHNCSELFESYHSLANEKLVRATLSKFYIEDAPRESLDFDDRFDWENTPFYNRLKTRVRAHFKEKSNLSCGHRANLSQWSQLAGFIIASAVAFRGFMQGCFLPMLLLPFCYWWGPSSCMHDGGHFSLSSRPWVNRLFGSLGGAHMSMFSWYHQHVIGHHVDTNMSGCDPDLYHFCVSVDGTPGFRTSVEQRTLPERCNGISRNRWWRLGIWIRMPFTTLGPSIIWDVISLGNVQCAQGFLGLVPYRQLWLNGLGVHSIGRSLIIWLAIIHPITVCLVTANNWFTGAARAIIFVLAPYAIHGCIFYIFSQVSHVQEECSMIALDEVDMTRWHHDHPPEPWHQKWGRIREFQNPKRNATNYECTGLGLQRDFEKTGQPREWAIHQVRTSLDYAEDSRFWLHISNGLNLQTVHHLFPQVGWGHYTELSRIVRDVCDELSVKHNSKSSFSQAVASHFKYLNVINSEPYASVWVRPPPGRACVATLDVLDQLDYNKKS